MNNEHTRELLFARAVRAFKIAPTKLIGGRAQFVCPHCSKQAGEYVFHEGIVVGWRCTEASGFVLTVEIEGDELFPVEMHVTQTTSVEPPP